MAPRSLGTMLRTSRCVWRSRSIVRPPPDGKAGKVDLGVLCAFAEDHMSAGAAQWQDHLADFGNRQVDLGELLLFLAQHGCCPGLYVQICLWVAQGVERSFGSMAVPASRRPSAPVSHGTAVAQWSKAALDRPLAARIHKSRAHSEDFFSLRFASVATDKSSVGGLPLQTSFLQLGCSDVVFPALAQASLAAPNAPCCQSAFWVG